MSNSYLSQITINDSIGSLNNVFSENYILKFTGQGNISISGFDTPDNNSIMIINNSGFAMILKHNSTDSLEENRMWFHNELNFSIPDDAMVTFKYFTDIQKYVMVSSVGTGNDGTELDPLFSASPSKNINIDDLQKLKNLGLEGDLFTVMSDGFTDTYTIEHRIGFQPKSVILTRCNGASIWTELHVDDEFITFTLSNVPPENVTIAIYWFALK